MIDPSEGGRDNLLETSLIPENADEQNYKKMSLLVQAKKNRLIAAAQKEQWKNICNELATIPANSPLQQSLATQSKVKIDWITKMYYEFY